MWTPVLPGQLASLDVGEIATSAPPERWHGPLQSLGTHRRGGAWVVSGRRDVVTALASPALTVAPAAGPGGAAAGLVARMARFSDGPDHRIRRDLLTRMLPSVAAVSKIAGRRANSHLRRRLATFDIMPMARVLPAEVLARALRLPEDAADRAAELTSALCDALAPTLVQKAQADPDAAARELTALLAAFGYPGEDQQTAAISILYQARDATAALIGTAVLAEPGTASAVGQHRPSVRGEPGGASPGLRVDRVLRHEAPVQCTRRTATADVPVGGAVLSAGAPVWVFVATAETGSGMPATFGTGPHACPGAAQATAIARQVVTVLYADGWRPVAGQRIDLEPRPNVRVPSRVLVSRP
jgi:cytochrome P450